MGRSKGRSKGHVSMKRRTQDVIATVPNQQGLWPKVTTATGAFWYPIICFSSPKKFQLLGKLGKNRGEFRKLKAAVAKANGTPVFSLFDFRYEHFRIDEEGVKHKVDKIRIREFEKREIEVYWKPFVPGLPMPLPYPQIVPAPAAPPTLQVRRQSVPPSLAPRFPVLVPNRGRSLSPNVQVRRHFSPPPPAPRLPVPVPNRSGSLSPNVQAVGPVVRRRRLVPRGGSPLLGQPASGPIFAADYMEEEINDEMDEQVEEKMEEDSGEKMADADGIRSENEFVEEEDEQDPEFDEGDVEIEEDLEMEDNLDDDNDNDE